MSDCSSLSATGSRGVVSQGFVRFANCTLGFNVHRLGDKTRLTLTQYLLINRRIDIPAADDYANLLIAKPLGIFEDRAQ